MFSLSWRLVILKGSYKYRHIQWNWGVRAQAYMQGLVYRKRYKYVGPLYYAAIIRLWISLSNRRLVSIKAAKYFDRMVFDPLIGSFVFIEVLMHLNLREQVSSLFWTGHHGDFFFPWLYTEVKFWKNIDIYEDFFSRNSDFAVLDVCISDPGATNLWNKSMVCYSSWGKLNTPGL